MLARRAPGPFVGHREEPRPRSLPPLHQDLAARGRVLERVLDQVVEHDRDVLVGGKHPHPGVAREADGVAARLASTSHRSPALTALR